MKNKRWIYLAIISAIIVLGLASRKHGDILPEFIAEYSGDTLWAAMVYCGIRFLFPSLSILKTIVISLLFSYCIEISQLYQADWANTVRNTTLGALIFGHGFLWSCSEQYGRDQAGLRGNQSPRYVLPHGIQPGSLLHAG